MIPLAILGLALIIAPVRARTHRPWQRAIVWALDLGFCQLCHRPVIPGVHDADVDHIRAASRGGHTSVINGALAHGARQRWAARALGVKQRGCNQRKGARRVDGMWQRVWITRAAAWGALVAVLALSRELGL